MNIFRELVEELKEENLLEDTVIDPVSKDGADADESSDSGVSVETEPSSEEQGVSVGSDDDYESFGGSDPDPATDPGYDSYGNIDVADMEAGEPSSADLPEDQDDFLQEAAETASESEEALVLNESSEDTEAAPPRGEEPKAKVRSADEERHFYRQRAMDEVTGLQLVEHVLSGVEREQMKSSPKTFDDLNVKRSLHDFLKVADNINSPEHAQAEFQLMQETENWASALSRRDRNISVAHLRRYCETTKPSLSSQAMISLARFYRNSPYSESVRSKFDLVFTRLFSKDVGEEKRKVVFKNEELVNHVQELYADWSSIPLYSTDNDDSELLLAALKFQEFIDEAQNAESFDELVRKDFFKRLKVFKEKTNENFFAPVLVAAAIESNVAVGNRYVELIEAERYRAESIDLAEKYGLIHDNSISEATSKTLELLDMLQTEKPEARMQPMRRNQEKKAARDKPKPQDIVSESKDQNLDSASGGVNKWLIVAAVVLALVAGWFYFGPGANSGSNTMMRGNGTAVDFNLEGTPLIKHVHSARISKNTLYGITRVSWDTLKAEEKEKVIEEAVAMGADNAFKQVHFLNGEGNSVAFGSKSKIRIY